MAQLPPLLQLPATTDPHVTRLGAALQRQWATLAQTINAPASGTFDVTRYGAVGDGATDATAAIVAALAAAAAAGGGIVTFPPGTYIVTDRISLPSNVSMCGAGMDFSIIRRAFDVDEVTFDQLDPVANNTIADLTFDDDIDTNVLASATWIVDGTDLHFERVRFMNWGLRAIACLGSLRTTVHNCEFIGVGSAVGGLDPVAPRRSDTGIFAPSNESEWSSGRIYSPESSIIGCRLRNCALGSVYVCGWLVADNVDSGSAYYATGGVFVSYSTGSLVEPLPPTQILNNLIEGGGELCTGIEIQGPTICIGNRIRRVGRDGIGISAPPFIDGDGNNIVVIGNIIEDAARETAGWPGILVIADATHFSIIGNSIFDRDTAQTGHGVEVQAGTSDYYTIFGNSVRNVTGLPVLDGGTGTHKAIEQGGILQLGPAQITKGSGTGVTVADAGSVRRVTYTVTVTYQALAAAAATADKVIATLPAKTRLVSIIADTTTPYTGGAVSAATLIVGKTTGGNQYLVSHDVLSGAITRGLADGDLGTSINRASAVQGGDLPSWTGTTDVSVRLSTTGANTNALTAGATVFYLTTEAMS